MIWLLDRFSSFFVLLLYIIFSFIFVGDSGVYTDRYTPVLFMIVFFF